MQLKMDFVFNLNQNQIKKSKMGLQLVTSKWKKSWKKQMDKKTNELIWGSDIILPII